MAKLTNKKQKRKTKKEITDALVALFKESPSTTLSQNKICTLLKLKTHPQKMLCRDLMETLVNDDFLIEQGKGKYKLNQRGIVLTGTFQRKSNGKNSFHPDDEGEPIFIAERNSGHAMNKDRVRIVFYARKKNSEPEGEVIEIIERANDTFVGNLEVTKSYAFLVTEDRTLANDIFIPSDKLKGGKTGDKAVVRVIEWPKKAKNPIGEVIDVLGRAGDNTTEMHAILAEFGLPYSYPKEVEKFADDISEVIPEEEYKNRLDYRNITTFTIDPEDAKDFDDALSIQFLKNGETEVGVHIADVTHYVKEGDVIRSEERRVGKECRSRWSPYH